MFITTRLFPTRPLRGSRWHKVLERDVLVYRHGWLIIVSGFFEPIFYLLGIGFGLGTLVGDVGDISYAAFVAPGLMASAAMNGALFESTFNLFFKLKYARTFEAILATPLGPGDIAIGEISWALIRGLMYATAFLLVMTVLGLVLSPWAILAIPGALLIGFAAAALGMAATTYMRKWQDFDLVTVVMMPLFLFSGIFFPITAYPDWLRIIVEFTPLYRGVHMLRSFSTGDVGPLVLVDVAYLAILGLVGVAITSRRLRHLLLK
ncbi:MAG: ABC transporter permease [Chloroflexota bacterium]